MIEHVVAGDARQIVGAVEAVREVIGKNRQHDVERMAQEVDDRRLGKMRPMRPRWVSFSGILSVNQRAPLPNCAELAGALKIIVAQIVERLDLVAEPELREGLRIGERAHQHTRDEAGQLADDRQFVAGADQRMSAQGLLDHRRAGTGKPDDEDRLGDIGADAGARQDLEPRRDEEGLEAPDQRRRLLGQIALAGQRAQSSLGLAEGGEGLGVAANPVEQETLLAPFDRPEAAALAPLFDVVERGQRLDRSA